MPQQLRRPREPLTHRSHTYNRAATDPTMSPRRQTNNVKSWRTHQPKPPPPTRQPYKPSRAERRRLTASISTPTRLLELVELFSFGVNFCLIPWDLVWRTGGPALTTNFAYWGLNSTSPQLNNERLDVLQKMEISWAVGLDEREFRSGVLELVVRGWGEAAETLAAIHVGKRGRGGVTWVIGTRTFEL